MKRRILAFLCVLSLLIGMLVMPAAAATTDTTAATSYKVGYAKVDLNPFINTEATAAVTGGLGIADQTYTDTEYVGKITIQTSATETAEVDFVMPHLGGYGDVSVRLANNLTDDNGDGIVGLGDGLFGTATSVTDNWGNTVIYITMDFINGNQYLTSAVRNAVSEQLSIKGNQIMISGSHSHEAPDFGKLYSSWYNNMNTANKNATGNVTALGTYWLYLIDQLTAAAVSAYNNATNATMSKGSIEAPTAMAAMGYKYSDGTGYKLNFVRHYKVVKIVESVTMTRSNWYNSDWSEQNSEEVSKEVLYYLGDNFGGSFTASESTTEGDYGWFDTSRTDTRTITKLEHATEGNQSMNLLQFTPTNGGKPIVMVEWRAHASNNGHSYFTNLSSDYVNALRYRLENNATLFGGDTDYYVGFWQGASGNNNATSRISTEFYYNSTTGATDPTVNKGYMTVALDDNGDGADDVKVVANSNKGTEGFYYDYYSSITQSTAYKDEFYKAAKYGYILGKVALYGLDNSMTQITDYGKIRTIQSGYSAARRTWGDGYFEAAYEAKITKGLTTTSGYPYAASNGITINSYYHANAILGDYTYTSSTSYAPRTTPTTMELNAILMGSQVALVTGTGELFDNYNSDPENDPDYNKWVELVSSETYGTPFTLSYTNHSTGYAPNVLAYEFPTSEDGTAIGSYEANTTDLAEGTGEAVIDEFAKMLDLIANGYVTYECPEHGNVEWSPLTAGAAGVDYLGTGHYYMTADFPIEASVQKYAGSGESICLDLKGHSITTKGRSLNIAAGGTLTVIDTVGGGSIVSHSGSNNPGGGTFTLSGTLNIYGGTFGHVQDTTASHGGTGVGGVGSVYGTLNMYGGTIEGVDMVACTYSSFVNSGINGVAGALYVNGGKAYFHNDAKVTSGSVPESGYGPCVVLANKTTSKVYLYDNASVEDIYYRYNGGSNVTVSGTYTGTTGLSFHTDIALQQNLDIGDVTTGTDISGAKLTVNDSTGDWSVGTSGTNLVLKGYSDSTKAVIISGSTETEYESLAAAVKAYSTGYIKLIQDDSSAVTVSKDTYLDLNGNDATGAITVSAGTLYGMDSMTDDYTVNDAYGYGKLTNVTGSVAGVPVDVDIADDGYLKVTETAGVSFHRVNLKITHMTLRQRNDDDAEDVYNPGVYYKAQDSFAADEIVAAKVQKFGIAMSATVEPTEANLEENCEYSWFTGFAAGENANSASGTLLRGVLKETNANLINRRNANTVVYGKAYILTDDGYMFGDCVERTFRQQVEAVDDIWSTLSAEQKELTIAMYQTYSGTMSSWDIPNILQELQSDEYQTLKVLVVGNSHGLDATNLLYEVFKAEAPDQKVVLGALYYSGCNINQHANYMKTDAAEYDYYKNGNYEGANADGSWTIVKGTTAQYGLADEQWDIVVMQQMNHRSAYDASSENNFNKTNYQYVINYINDNVKNGVEPKLAWHMVWTNPDQEEYLDPDSDLSHPTKTNTDWVDTHNAWFPGTDGTYDQSVMYQGIVDCLKEYIIDSDNSFLGSDTFDYILPSGLAIEYAQDVLGCSQAQVYRDYTHMNDYGRLITAYLWYAELMGLDAVDSVDVGIIPSVLHHGNSTILETNADGDYVVPDYMKRIAREAVNFALENPYDYQLTSGEEEEAPAILTIGNSYSIDSMWLLNEVYKAEKGTSTNLKLGIAYYSGCTLASHVSFINDNAAVYNYYYLNDNGTWTIEEEVTLEYILKAQQWNTVTLQQGSSQSGLASTYNGNIQTIQSYAESILGDVTFMWNMTWAYPEEDIEGDAYDLTTRPNASSFEKYYGNSQATMYQMITEAVQAKIVTDPTFQYLMPVGTAVQNAQSSYMTDQDLYRDYTHLSDYARLVAAYTWYCELEHTTLDSVQLTKVPEALTKSYTAGGDMTLTETEINILVESVKNAMLKSFEVTDSAYTTAP